MLFGASQRLLCRSWPSGSGRLRNPSLSRQASPRAFTAEETLKPAEIFRPAGEKALKDAALDPRQRVFSALRTPLHSSISDLPDPAVKGRSSSTAPGGLFRKMVAALKLMRTLAKRAPVDEGVRNGYDGRACDSRTGNKVMSGGLGNLSLFRRASRTI